VFCLPTLEANGQDTTTTRTLTLTIEAPRASTPLRAPCGLVDDGSKIGRLPVELILAIFHHSDPAIKARLKLTHVCRRWRLISLKSATLWTQVHIIPYCHRKDEKTFTRFLSLLEMQLDHADNLDLDVLWIDDVIKSWNSRVLKLLREKAPFSRWRSLTVCLWGRDADPNVIFGPQDAFTNLESLAVLSRTLDSIVLSISRMTTPRLRMLDLGDWYSVASMGSLYPEALDRVSYIVFPKQQTSFAETFSLPPGVTDLEAKYSRNHSFPHISTYTVSQCTFSRHRETNLQNLTRLTVTAELRVRARCEISLPALLSLTCWRIWLGKSAKLEAPRLERLHIRARHPRELTRALAAEASAAFHHPGFLLCPRTSLRVEWCLAPDVLSRLLERSPRVKEVSLWFKDRDGLYLTMMSMFGTKAERPGGLCPCVEVLRLHFVWDIGEASIRSEVRHRRAFVRQAADFRKGTGSRVLEIYGTWKGQGASVRLA